MKYTEKLGDGYITIEDHDLKSSGFSSIWDFFKKLILLVIGGGIMYFIIILVLNIFGLILSLFI